MLTSSSAHSQHLSDHVTGLNGQHLGFMAIKDAQGHCWGLRSQRTSFHRDTIGIVSVYTMMFFYLESMMSIGIPFIVTYWYTVDMNVGCIYIYRHTYIYIHIHMHIHIHIHIHMHLHMHIHIQIHTHIYIYIHIHIYIIVEIPVTRMSLLCWVYIN